MVITQTAEQMCFYFPPAPGERKGCCPEHWHQEKVGSYRVGTALPPVRSHGGGLCCTCQSRRAGSAFLPLPRPDRSQLPVPSTPHSAASMGCSVQHLLYRMRLVQNGKNGLGQEAQSTAQPPAALRKCNPFYLKSFLPQSCLTPISLLTA